MFHSKLKETLNTSIAEVVSDIDSFVYNPGRDYSRVKKLSADQVLSFLISQGASSTKCEFLDFFQMSPETRSQLKPEALETVFISLRLLHANWMFHLKSSATNTLPLMVLLFLFSVFQSSHPMIILFQKGIL